MGFAASLATLMARIGSTKLSTLPGVSIEVSLDVIRSANWIENREQAAMRALAAGKTHLMFLDDDMVFEPQVFEIMLGRQLKVVCANYLIKTRARDTFVAVGLDGQRVPTLESSTGVVPIAYSGFGASIFSTDVFKTIPQPWFLPKWIPELNTYTTEDNPFYEKVRAKGFQVFLDHDASKFVGHVGHDVWNWDEYQAKELK